MNPTLNFLDTAGAIADVDRLPGKLVPTLLRRIRVFDTKNLVPVYREETGRREGRLDLVGACMARVHSELIDFGLDAETLRGLREFFDRKAEMGKATTQFAAAVDAVKAGSPVTLEVILQQSFEPWSKWHHFRLSGHMEKSARVAAALAARDLKSGVVERASLKIDLTELLGAFVKAFEIASASAQEKE